MNKRLFAFAMVVMLIVCALSSCGTVSTEDEAAINMANFKVIEDEEGLVYNKDTRVVYYMFSTGQGYAGYGYLAPYISENGRFCKYINDEIVEIIPESNNN